MSFEEGNMIKSVRFRNFKALRHTTLPLQQFTLIVGPNGSGKSTALQALKAVGRNEPLDDFASVVPAGSEDREKDTIEIVVQWGPPYDGAEIGRCYSPQVTTDSFCFDGYGRQDAELETILRSDLATMRIYALDPRAAAAQAQILPRATLGEDGSNLAAVIENLRDHEPEKFEALNAEIQNWLPEFDRVLLDTLVPGQKALFLRMRGTPHRIAAAHLSHGSLIALTILTLAHLPNPPAIMCFEEPDRGIHPRLLRDVRDALYRLSYPEGSGEKRQPVQVIATTHSPYLLDLFKDRPEEVVIADRHGQDVQFERLSDRDDLDEILGDAQLGDAWYSGVLGGVPSSP